MKKGDKVKIWENVADELGLSSDEIYEVIDILENDEFPIVLKCDSYGKNWVEFFNEDEIDPISD